MQLFYNPEITPATESFSFDREESKHIVKVLRKRENDILFVTNGLGCLFKTEITFGAENKCTVKILSFEQAEPIAPKLHLAVAPTKMNERYEWFLEKATEIGISEITPVICEHSERKIIKTERFDKIILSAMKQSNQYFLPKLNAPVSFKDLVSQNTATQKFIAHCEPSQRMAFKSALAPGRDALVLIGPEGDFSAKEIEMALKNDYLPVTLGSTRLRTETAAIVACHSFAFANEPV